MSNRDWFEDYEVNARQAGDAPRVQLGKLHREAYRHRESDPDHALDLIAQGRRLAESLREPWWELFYDQQRVHALLHFKQDFRDVLELAVRNTLEIRKPGLTGFPRRLLVHLDLVSAYLGIDPVGHADAMRQSLDYLESESEPLSDERYLVLGSRRQFVLDLDQLDEARKLAKQSQSLAAEDSDRSRANHFLVFTYSGLAEIAFRKGDMGALSDASEAGMDMARQVGHQVELAGFQLWRALVCRRQRREAQASSLVEQAVSRLGRLRMPPDASYRDAECAFHELGGNHDQALRVRDGELAAIESKGRLWYEAQVHVKRCELRARMGVVSADDLQRASEAISRLRAPEVLRQRLAHLGPDQGEGRAMTIWDWIHDFERRAVESGDRQRKRLARIHSEAYRFRQSDPDRMLALLDEGHRLAVALGEAWWELFFDHWRLETLIYYKDDYRNVIELGVRATLQLRKPAFDGFPLRFGIYCNLLAAYLCVDPRGYAQAIRDAIEYLRHELPPDGSDRYLLQARRHWFAYEIGELDEAERLAKEELSMCDSDPDRHTAKHHEADTCKALCWIAYRRRDLRALGRWASTGEQVSRDIEYRYEQALFLMWLALLARHGGDEGEARQLCRQGVSIMERLGQAPGESYHDALARYHERGGEREAAWRVRQSELQLTQGKGQFAYEALVRLKRVRLLMSMGHATADEESAARQAISRLRAPAWYLAELDRVLAGRPAVGDHRVG